MQAEKESTVHKVIPHLKDILAHLGRMKTLSQELELDFHSVSDPFFPLIRGDTFFQVI